MEWVSQRLQDALNVKRLVCPMFPLFAITKKFEEWSASVATFIGKRWVGVALMRKD